VAHANNCNHFFNRSRQNRRIMTEHAGSALFGQRGCDSWKIGKKARLASKKPAGSRISSQK